MPSMAILRGNQGTLPNSQGGSTSSLPPDLQAMVDFLQPVVQQFRDNSTPMKIQLDLQTLKIGSTKDFRIASTGLGERIIHKVTGSLYVQNTAGTAQVVQLSPFFPYNTITNVNTQINGQTSVSNASPVAYIFEQAERVRSFPINPLNSRVCKVTAGANVTLTTGSPSLCGYTQCTIAANQTGIINFTFYFTTAFVLNRDSLIGLLPLQNPATYATVTYSTASNLIGVDPSSPMYVSGGVPSTLTYDSKDSVITSLPRYDFWTVPGNANLYQELIMNSFQLIEQTSLTFSATGQDALNFPFPLNSYLLRASFFVRDANNNIVNTDNVFQNLKLEYNSNIRPFSSDLGIHEYDQFMHYNNDFSQFGVLMWDGTDTADGVNCADSTGWMDLYNTSNPAFKSDVIASSITTPGQYSFVRAQIVPSDVKVLPA